MAKFKPQYKRLLFIDSRIREGRYPNCFSLAEEYEVSRKTIQRDIEYMRHMLGAPIAYSAKKRGYYYTEEQYRLPAMAIKESDLFAIYLAEKLLEQYEGTPLYHSLKSVFQKIADSLPEHLSADRAGEQSRFTVLPPFSTVVDPEIWQTVMGALRENRQVEVLYKTPGRRPVRRRIDPYHAVRYEGDWYLVGWCHLRGEIRTFSISRMLEARQTGRGFTIPEDFDFRRLAGSHFGLHWGPGEVRVRIRFDASVADYIQERRWHPSQEIRRLPDGSIELSMTVNHLLELRRWILSWGDAAEVLEPYSLRKELLQICRRTAAKYSDGAPS